MAKSHLSARIDAEILAALDLYAEAHGMTRTEALQTLLVDALEGGEGREDGGADREEGAGLRDVCDVLRQSNADLRSTVSTLTAQLSAKDEQLRQALTLAYHAQARPQMLEAAGGADMATGTATGGNSLRARLARWIAGRDGAWHKEG